MKVHLIEIFLSVSIKDRFKTGLKESTLIHKNISNNWKLEEACMGVKVYKHLNSLSGTHNSRTILWPNVCLQLMSQLDQGFLVKTMKGFQGRWRQKTRFAHRLKLSGTLISYIKNWIRRFNIDSSTKLHMKAFSKEEE